MTRLITYTAYTVCGFPALPYNLGILVTLGHDRGARPCGRMVAAAVTGQTTPGVFNRRRGETNRWNLAQSTGLLLAIPGVGMSRY